LPDGPARSGTIELPPPGGPDRRDLTILQRMQPFLLELR
jgi:hypothetical protein